MFKKAVKAQSPLELSLVSKKQQPQATDAGAEHTTSKQHYSLSTKWETSTLLSPLPFKSLENICHNTHSHRLSLTTCLLSLLYFCTPTPTHPRTYYHNHMMSHTDLMLLLLSVLSQPPQARCLVEEREGEVCNKNAIVPIPVLWDDIIFHFRTRKGDSDKRVFVFATLSRWIPSSLSFLYNY